MRATALCSSHLHKKLFLSGYGTRCAGSLAYTTGRSTRCRGAHSRQHRHTPAATATFASGAPRGHVDSVASARDEAQKHQADTSNRAAAQTKVQSYFQRMRQLFNMMKFHEDFHWRLALAFTMIFLSRVAGLMVPWCMKVVLEAPSVDAALWPAMSAAALLCAGIILREEAYPRFSPLSNEAAERLGDQTFTHLLAWDMQTHKSYRPHALERAMSKGMKSVKDLLRSLVFTALPTILELLCVLVWLWLQFNSTAVGIYVPLAVLGTVGVHSWWTYKACQPEGRAYKKQRQQQAAASKASNMANNALRNMPSVKLHANAEYERQRFGGQSGKARQLSVETNHLYAAVATGQALILLGGSSLVMYAAVKASPPSASPRDLVPLFGLLLHLLLPLRTLADDYRKSGQARAQLDELFDILTTQGTPHYGTVQLPDLPPGHASPQLQMQSAAESSNGHSSDSYSSSSSDEGSGGQSQPVLVAASADLHERLGLQIDLSKAHFAYQRQRDKKKRSNNKSSQDRAAPPPVLNGVDLHIHSGDRIGIVGASGSGKSTLLQLIAAMLFTVSGTAAVNGVSVQDLDLKSLQGAIAFVPQEAYLNDDESIMDNIRYGKITATDEEVVAAAKLVHLHDAVQSMSSSEEHKGYSTVLGEGGFQLSGGLKQRVELARAFLRAPRLLILDDATSALDADTEHEILKNLNLELKQGSLKGCTLIVVSHRLSTVKFLCDRTFKLADGNLTPLDVTK